MKIRFFPIVLSAVTFASVLTAGQGPQPSICTRPCWGARAPRSTPSQMSALNRAIIHHTAGVSDYTTSYETGKAKVRGVQNIHMDANGWSDIGYHFLVSAGGHIYEGRSGSMSSLPIGAHDGYNVNSFGFTCLGNFADFSEGGGANQQPPAAMLNSVYDVIAWRMPSAWSPYGSGTYNGNTVGVLDGHRKVKATACPGNNIYNVHITSNYSGGNARNGVNARKNPAPPSERLDVFVRGAGDALFQKAYDNNQWYNWVNLGGVMTSDPTAVSWGANRIDVFYRNLNGALQQVSWTGAQWVLNALGGNLSGAPDATSWGTGRLDVFWRGADNTLRHKAYDNNTWYPEENLGGALTSDPTAVSWGYNRIDVFMRGADNGLHHLSWTGTGWVWGAKLADNLGGGADACSWGANRLDVFWRGADNTLRHRAYDGSSWYGESNLGGILTSDPGVATWGFNRIDVFTRGTDGTAVQTTWTGTSWVWNNLGGGMTGGPDACSWTR